MTHKRVLVVNDFVGTSHIALNLQIDYLYSNKLEAVSIPTGIISNSFNLGQPIVLDLTDYLNESLKQFDLLGFEFSALLTGYLLNMKQADSLIDWKKKNDDVLMVTDPILGDKGALYKSLTRESIKYYRALAHSSDVLVPNMTEAQFLLDESDIKHSMNNSQMEELTMKLHQLNNKSVVITSAMIDDAPHIVGYDHIAKTYFKSEYTFIEGLFYGTGDLFSVALLCALIEGQTLLEAAQVANQAVTKLIRRYKD